jgi:hypothetical protein
MVEENSVTTALYRLARLETHPIRSATDLLDWARLRKWVLSDSRLLQQYQEQHYFSCADEVTKIQYAPKNSSSIFPRFWSFFKKAGTGRK